MDRLNAFRSRLAAALDARGRKADFARFLANVPDGTPVQHPAVKVRTVQIARFLSQGRGANGEFVLAALDFLGRR